MNVYDFDKTIYKYDSSKRFYFFILRKKPLLFFHLFVSGFWGLLLAVHLVELRTFKEYFFSIFRHISNIDLLLKEFWDKEVLNINVWYLKSRKPDDVVCTASPEFLVREGMDRVNKRAIVIGSKIDKKTGKFEENTKNCKGEEKVARLKEAGYTTFQNGYGDSISDVPMLTLCQNRFRVVKSEIVPFEKKYFEKYEKSTLQTEDNSI